MARSDVTARWLERRSPARRACRGGAVSVTRRSTSDSASSSGTRRSAAACSPARSPTGSSSSSCRPRCCSSRASGSMRAPPTRAPSEAAKEAGLHGLIASQVASASSDGARWLVFILMVPAVLYATATLYRALAIVHGIVWQGSGRGARVTPRGIGMLFASAPARDRRRPDRGLDPPARPAGRALRTARLPRARRRRVAAGLAAAAAPRRPRGTPSSPVPRWWAWACCS